MPIPVSGLCRMEVAPHRLTVEFRSKFMTDTDVQQGRINDQLGTQLESLSAQVEAKVEQGKNRLNEWKSTIQDRSKQAYSSVDTFTRNSPWKALGVAVLSGWVIGRIMSR
jgi:ElaB/YqjD/DUF883 family membrane-anchored ribosome-binding protein